MKNKKEEVMKIFTLQVNIQKAASNIKTTKVYLNEEDFTKKGRVDS